MPYYGAPAATVTTWSGATNTTWSTRVKELHSRGPRRHAGFEACLGSSRRGCHPERSRGVPRNGPGDRTR